ncbi:hypothetical protein BDU57DRAFT_520662 [Ampelomyces quisqualis]|uniref:Uncharacterized protein n=1 Tax=Ampelomyces quisqualis TaxID=50730 RepID=A0A6A5QG52_AMPQU|nr:hypothetical protein BDU57DRAFT_520662 [Ampelomyces quisqualis]
MVGPFDPSKSAAEVRRERDVFSLYAAFQDIPIIEKLGCSPDTHSIPGDYVPRPASDASLAAFCQLAAMRLNAARSLISLIDDKYQYILAEATPNTSLKADSPLNKTNDLGFGSVRLPRCWGVCERVLDPAALADGDGGIVIINDLTKSEQHSKRSYVKDGPLRFYAGVPLVTKSGNVVGAICILDNVVRDGLSHDGILYLRDLAGVIMKYLDTYVVKDRYRRAAEGLHGLMSFAEGGSSSRTSSEQIHSLNVLTNVSSATVRSHQDHSPEIECGRQRATSEFDSFAHQSRKRPKSACRDSPAILSADELQKDLLPATTKLLFARAADIMRSSNDMDGVMFMDASFASVGSQCTSPLNSGKRCQILGFATNEESSLKGEVLTKTMTPHESNFKWVLDQYPHGYSLSCDDADDDLNAEEQVPGDRQCNPPDSPQEGQNFIKDKALLTARVKALIPNIKSAMFLPLWDYERGRWFAGCFCWSSKAERVLDGRFDLPFLKAFGHSIMQEVARLDALTTTQAKTTFLSSLSHELRTPLHGILGSIHLMRNSRLDSFRSSMLNAITICGRTLLETVEHLLDHAERPEAGHNHNSAIIRGHNSICISSEKASLQNTSADDSEKPRCNVGFVTEEVVETMIVGEAPFDITLDSDEHDKPAMNYSRSQAIAKRRSRFIILDVGDYGGLGFHLSASSFGRIIMNLFGNALKFTETGYVHVTVRSEDLTESRGTVILTISDSGVGMKSRFLQEQAFEPFHKQSQHTAGTGVGLSVVRRILEDIGGQLDVCSQFMKGTDIVLKLPLERLSEGDGHDPKINPLPVAMSGLKGRKVCVLYTGEDPSDEPAQAKHKQTVKRYVEVLTSTLSNVLQVDIWHSNVWDGFDGSEVVICPEVSFESLHTIRETAAKAGRKCPAIILVAMDILEAETLRCDARVTGKESIVETITQPCGPYKLSVALNSCLHKYDSQSTSATPTSPTTPISSPQTSTKMALSHSSQFRPKLGLYPPLVTRTKSSNTLEQMAPPEDQDPNQEASNVPPPTPAIEKVQVSQALIVDDNAINRRLLSAWMKKHKIAYQEAKDGLAALDTYKSCSGSFDLILMDISMPVMDGMTCTRLVREYEKESNVEAAHIIALTGLTSASAKLEAWTSGVDDFLTKPVDFKRLEWLTEAGRGGEGTGFMKEQGSIVRDGK